jgi:hypothetical protein
MAAEEPADPGGTRCTRGTPAFPSGDALVVVLSFCSFSDLLRHIALTNRAVWHTLRSNAAAWPPALHLGQAVPPLRLALPWQRVSAIHTKTANRIEVVCHVARGLEVRRCCVA